MNTNDKLKNKTVNGTKPVLYADWRRVKDEMPKIIPNSNGGCSEEVLVWIVTEERLKYTESQRQIAYYTNEGWCYQYGELMYDDDMKGVTHWMPLPPSPIC